MDRTSRVDENRVSALRAAYPWPRSTVARRVAAGLAMAWIALLSGCGDSPRAPHGDVAPIPVTEPRTRAPDGLVRNPVLQQVVEAGLRRDGVALGAFMAHDDAAVRARAAFVAASVPDVRLEDALVTLLADGDPGVRADAAFGLGQKSPDDGGAALARALETEADPDVRASLLDALGRVGDPAVLGGLLGMTPPSGEQDAWYGALARAGLRGVDPPGTPQVMVGGLADDRRQIRELAGYYFAMHPRPEAWVEELDALRQALDGHPMDAPEARYLVLALGVQRQRADAPRIIARLAEAQDWRVRNAAARALGGTVMLETPGVREALFAALTDDAHHVGTTAALALTQGFRIPQAVLDRASSWIQESRQAWHTHLPFVAMLSTLYETQDVLDWVRRMLESEPDAAAWAVEVVAPTEAPGVDELLVELLDHEHPRLRGVAYRVLAREWPLHVWEEGDAEAWYERFATEVRTGPVPAAAPAAEALSDVAFLALGSGDDLRAGYARALDQGEFHLLEAVLRAATRSADPALVALVEGALEHEDFRVRRLAGSALEAYSVRAVSADETAVPNPEVVPDWAMLATLGDEPRIRIRTEQGDLVVRLAVEEAPQTVQALLDQVRQGLHDDLAIHRVEPGRLIQGGDYVMEDGSGNPGFLLRTELTRLAFRRGVVGMASAGRDTETTQFFVLHDADLSLDGEFTAFGWVEEGAGVLDRLRAWDRVLSVEVQDAPVG